MDAGLKIKIVIVRFIFKGKKEYNIKEIPTLTYWPVENLIKFLRQQEGLWCYKNLRKHIKTVQKELFRNELIMLRFRVQLYQYFFFRMS